LAEFGAKKKPPEGGFVKVPEGTSLEPVEANLLAGLASILVNCDSSWMHCKVGARFVTSPVYGMPPNFGLV
jgi:hypothetical protein